MENRLLSNYKVTGYFAGYTTRLNGGIVYEKRVETKSTGRQTLVSKVSYVKRNWQLYVFFLMPALVLTIIFKYLPMGGLLIAFEDYNVIKGVFGSPWVGLEYFKRFLSSPDFMSYLLNTLKLSIYGIITEPDP